MVYALCGSKKFRPKVANFHLRQQSRDLEEKLANFPRTERDAAGLQPVDVNHLRRSTRVDPLSLRTRGNLCDG